MSALIKALFSPFKYGLQFFHKHSRPNPRFFPDQRQLEVAHKRIKALVFNQMLIFCIFVLNIITGNGQLETNLHGVCSTSTISIASMLMSNLHPEIYRSFFNFVAIAFGVLLSNQGYEGLHGSWICTTNFPMLVYLATGSLWQFGANMLIHMYLINTSYQNPLKSSVMWMDPDSFVKSLTYQTNQALVYSVSFTIFTHFLIEQALTDATVAEQKKNDFENQKNFLLSFSHELRNLLNSLIGNVKLAYLEAVSDKAKDLLANAELCAEMLLHLINNILDTGKVELGDLEINTSPGKIYDIMERLWSVCSELIKNRNLRGRFRIQKNIPKVLNLDHYRLTQIFLNLVGNAVKYTDCGEIDISVEWISDRETVTEKCFEPYPFNEENDTDEGIFEKTQTLSVLDERLIFLNFVTKKIDRNALPTTVNSSKGVLKITVRDTGIGIPKDGLGKLFQKFTQVTSDPSKKKLGTGLGLYITKQLCERMNGDVRVFSRQGKGSTFIICLPVEPVVENNAYLLERDLIRKLVLRKNLKAMIVDDEPFNHMILREFLHKLGVEVVEFAENGLVAYQKYLARATSEQDCINIVTMDLNMPVMDGKTSAQKIREVEALKRINNCFIVVISANCTESEINACVDRNGPIRADGFLKKPATIDEMSRLISSYLARIYDEHEIRLLSST